MNLRTIDSHTQGAFYKRLFLLAVFLCWLYAPANTGRAVGEPGLSSRPCGVHPWRGLCVQRLRSVVLYRVSIQIVRRNEIVVSLLDDFHLIAFDCQFEQGNSLIRHELSRDRLAPKSGESF